MRQLAYGLNSLLVVRPSLWLDRVLGLGRLFPLGYSLVAYKPDAQRTR